MSIFGKIAGAAIGALGGAIAGNQAPQHNLARNFSARCGITPPVASSVAATAMARFPGNFASQCTYARTGAAPLPQIPRATFPSPAPATSGGGGFGLIGTAQASPFMAAGAAFGVIRGVTGKILSFIAPNGIKFSRKAVVDAAKAMGIGAVAAQLAVSEKDIAEAVLTELTKKRRRRGITASDLATTRRTSCKIARMSRDLGIKPAVRRRTSCRS